MAKSVPAAVIDAMLTQAEGTTIAVCSAQPANYAGIAAVTLATAAISGSYAKAAGDVSGRKNTLPAQNGISITASGSATHVVVHNGVDLKLVTTCPSQALTSGGTVDVGAFAHEITEAA